VSALLVIAVALPALAGLGCVVARAGGAESPGRLGAAAAALPLVMSVALGVAVIADGPVSAVVAGGDGRAVFGLFADRLSVVMLLLVFGVSAVVQLFSSRYLSGDPRQARLIAAAGVTTSATSAVVTAATLSVLVGAWLVTGAGLLALLAQRTDLAPARLGVRRAATAFAVGDLALVAAGIVAWATVGDLDLRRVDAGAARLAGAHVSLLGASIGASGVVACLLVVAAMGRSAQIPLQRWLPATLAAPTPVSAFLHAGLVNAGGLLLVRLAPVFGASGLATHLAFAAGAATALYGTALMLAKPDVKGGLAHSTMGQMGFMVMACSLGALAAAIFHLIAHGMYKATLFLGADSVVHNDKRRAIVPRPAPAGASWAPGVRLAVAAAAPAAALALALATFASAALTHAGAVVLIAFAWATAAHAAWAWLAATPGRAAAGLGALAAACLAYAGLVAGANSFLDPALGTVGRAASPRLALVPAAIVVVALAARLRLSAAWRLRVYTWLLDAGHVAVARTGRARRRPPGALRRTPVVDSPQEAVA
jgi:NADH:ubiquinone oxidoreductase subunit 5 (subunit L)/multisubunit Na+/H+ antiporter MnhA subunit